MKGTGKTKSTKSTKKRSLLRKVQIYGYVKREGNRCLAVCVNLSVFAQGPDLLSALKRLLKAVDDYLAYVEEHHADEWEKYTDRPAPREMQNEYHRLAERLAKAVAKQKVEKGLSEGKVSKQEPVLSELAFASQVSTAYAPAGV